MTVLENALVVNDGKAVVISIKREWLSKIIAGENQTFDLLLNAQVVCHNCCDKYEHNT